MKRVFLILVWFGLVPFCVAQQKVDKGMSVIITSIDSSSRLDTLKVNFNIFENGKRLPFISGLFAKSFEVKEAGSDAANQPKVHSLLDNRGQKDLTILFLMDLSGSVSDSLLTSQGQLIGSIVRTYTQNRFYIAYMRNGTVSETFLLDSATYRNKIITDFYNGSQSGKKNLYRSILSKLQELSGDAQTYYPNVPSLSSLKNNHGEKILFVFTDGNEIDADKGDYYTCKLEYSRREDSIRKGEKENIPIHCVYVGNLSSLNKSLVTDLKSLCSIGKDDDKNGKFYQTLSPDSLHGLMMVALDSIVADYRLLLINPEGKQYNGSKLTLQVSTMVGDKYVVGEKSYSYGSILNPIDVTYEKKSSWTSVLFGLLLGVLSIAITYLILQYVYPVIGYKRFLKKYVVPYSKVKKENEDRNCYYCKNPFQGDDEIVIKCDHWVHKECWEANGNRCPEYGHYRCTQGIHHYNQEKKSDPKNATHYMQWILGGFAAGLLSWIGFRLLASANAFVGIMNSIAKIKYAFDINALSAVSNKTSGWLQGGICLGFFIVLAFGYILEYRKMNSKVIGQLMLRSFIGAILGWVSFFLGALLIILCGVDYAYTCWWIDWIPWLFFALTISLVLWFKTEIELKSALIGGTASVLFSFIVMFALTSEVTSMFSYMIYAAGLGCAIAVVHYASQLYYLKVDGEIKPREIAIFKWMSVAGGSNKVSIGKSSDCVIQMNWDSSKDISDRAVELYLKDERPYCKVLDAGVTQQGRNVPKGTELPLKPGSEFSIGKTKFTYVEKDA